ncbi:tRNA (adenine(37)-N6)-methyltransferase-like [Microtus ochrogaster]|uniref:tRNA (Adenine(37)-N6)-methyltransferase-like n=1 Tax=Microtus ochrogaster TaxID=79684 RepID=A0ABM0LAW1_MICOH|nr:tRNA (adenine(37)-N6)-methyltransferase-like [Microtus ochrogaster]
MLPEALHAETGPPLTAFSKTRHRATTAQAPKPTGRKRKREAAYGVWTIQRPAAMRGLAERGSCTPAAPCGCTQPALETGNLLTEPIGYLESCFLAKNGTPRQPSICSYSRACLKIRKSIFNNPEHSLMGLEQFSHVWILFVFHKNGHLNYKAKVQPPRLNGAKTGVFSTRSPHRPNAIGLTLAKLEKVEGNTVTALY